MPGLPCRQGEKEQSSALLVPKDSSQALDPVMAAVSSAFTGRGFFLKVIFVGKESRKGWRLWSTKPRSKRKDRLQHYKVNIGIYTYTYIYYIVEKIFRIPYIKLNFHNTNFHKASTICIYFSLSEPI